MPVNPDPTVTSLSLPLGSFGNVTATGTVWEMVGILTVASQNLTVPSGRYLVTSILTGSGANNPPAVTSQVDTTTSVTTINVPAATLRHIRDFTSTRTMNLRVDVKLRVGATWVPYATTGTGTVTMSAAAVPAAGSLPQFGASNGQVAGTVTSLTLVPQAYLDGPNQAISDMGMTLTRNDPQWMQLCPSSRTFDTTTQAAYDAYFTAIAAKSLKAVVFLEPIITSPAWAATSGVRGNPPASWTDFANYVSDFLTRWGANVAAVELINEPNINGYPDGAGSTTASDYVTFLGHLYTAVKGYSLSMPVLAGCLSLSDTTYLTSLYAQGGFKGNYDAISVHPYSVDNGQFDTPVNPAVSHDPSVAQLDARKAYDVLCGVEAVHEVMRANGEGTVPIWVTETGYQTGNTGTSGAFTSYDVSEAQQATYLAYTVRALARLGYVNAVLVYAARDTNTASTSILYGLMGYHGNRRKPAVAALTTAITGLKAGTG